MSKVTLYLGEDVELDGEKLSAALGEFIKSDVPLALEGVYADEEEIRSLNRQMRGVDKTTDVLSFPAVSLAPGKRVKKSDFPWGADEEGNYLFGSGVVCPARAAEQAQEYGHSYERELNFLFVHGAMHCHGYDHIEEEDKEKMRAAEESVLGKMGILRE